MNLMGFDMKKISSVISLCLVVVIGMLSCSRWCQKPGYLYIGKLRHPAHPGPGGLL